MKDFPVFMREALNIRLFGLGGSDFTLGSLLAALVASVALLMFARWLRRWISQRLLAKGHFDLSTRETVSALTHYVVLTIGFLSILNVAGIQLSSFTLLAGAFGVGLGFGLQNIFSNFISGLIVMFERPIKIGDHVVLSAVDGEVITIGMRATTLRTAQGSLVVVPNQTILTNNVVNWGHAAGSSMSLQFRLGGSIDEDTALLLRIVGASPDVLKLPAPEVYVIAVDEMGHLMEVNFHVRGDAVQRMRIISVIHSALADELTRSGKAFAPSS